MNIERVGQTIAGAAFATLGIGGGLGVYTLQATHLVVDFSCYFTGVTPAAPPFATSVSASGRYLLDQFDQPYLMQADSSWCLANQLTPAQADTFFANRAAQGFNTVLITWSCGSYEGWPSDGASFDGSKPFVNGDFAQPSSTYWSRFDQYVSLARAHGITIAIDTDTGSWQSAMLSAGQANIFNFGVFPGNLYGAYGNVMFVDGNDYGGGSPDGVVLAEMDGIRSVAPKVLQAVELFPTISTTYDDANAVSRSDWVSAYSYYPTYDVVLRAYRGTPTTIDTSKLLGNVAARWFDPTTGAFQPASAPYTTPGAHSDGTHDWVLVFG